MPRRFPGEMDDGEAYWLKHNRKHCSIYHWTTLLATFYNGEQSVRGLGHKKCMFTQHRTCFIFVKVTWSCQFNKGEFPVTGENIAEDKCSQGHTARLRSWLIIQDCIESTTMGTTITMPRDVYYTQERERHFILSNKIIFIQLPTEISRITINTRKPSSS